MKTGFMVSPGLVLMITLPIAAQMQGMHARDTFATAHLSRPEVQQILKQVEQSAYDVPDDWISELRVKRVDLGSSPGLVLQGSKLLCGATGNCEIWVFRKVGNTWLSLLPGDEAPIAEGFQLGPAKSGGIKDFTIVANSSAEAATTITYSFDGRRYRRK